MQGWSAHYYADGVCDYADAVFRVNRTMQKGGYQVRVAEDGPSVLFVHAISSRRSFDEKILRSKITGKEYRESKSSARVVAWDDTALEMQAKNVRPLNAGLCWGERRQVMQLRWKCTGTPTCVDKHYCPTPTEYGVKDKRGEWHVQCDCIVLDIVTVVRKAEEQTRAELEAECSHMDLFGIDGSQSQRSDIPPSPPPCQRKKREDERHAHAVDYSSEEFPVEDVEDSDDDGRGKRGGGGRGGGGAQEGVL